MDCGVVTTRCKGATEDPATSPHTETDTRGGSKTLVRLTCKACLKVVLELPRNEAAVRAGRAKETPRADRPRFRDVSRAMHVRPQVTLNALEVEVVLGLLTRNAHAHLSRFSSISGTEFVGLLDDAIESILEPTENLNGWNTGATTMTNDTSFVSGTEAKSSASHSKAFIAYCSNKTEVQSAFCENPSVFQEFVMFTERVCLLSWSLCWSLFFLHRHDDVTPSWFRALESYVLRVPDGNEIKLWSSPSLSVFTVFVDLLFLHTISVGLIFGCSVEQYFCCIFIVQRHW